MAAVEDSMCGSCFSPTKYTCLTCGNVFCITCSVFEEDEETPGWKAGRSVARCEACFREKMEKEVNERDFDQESETNISVSSRSSSSCGGKSLRSTAKNARDRVEDGKLEDGDVDENSNDDNDDEERGSLSLFVKKSKGKKKKSGRKSAWNPEDVDDLIDIVVSNTYYKRKLIFTNTKCQRNGEIYEEILTELKKRASARGKELKFSVKQLRTKFKKCVSDCKQAALTMRTATGIKRFQEDRGLGNWFKPLFAVVQTRDSCQPDQAIEPSSFEQSTSSEKSSKSADEDKSLQDDLGNNEDSEGGLFIPIKKRKKEKPKEKLAAAVMEAAELVKEVVNNDPTKDLISFLREEMNKSREHELKMIQLLSQPNLGSASFQQPPFQAMHHSESAQYAEGGPMTADYNQQWCRAFVPNVSNRPGLPEGSLRSFTPTYNMPSTSNEYFCDRNVYNNF